jgi:hypothetical protein
MASDVSLPLSGWRFAVERQPDGSVHLLRGPAGAPEITRRQPFRDLKVCGQSSRVWRTGMFRKTRSFLVYGRWEGSVEAAVFRLGEKGAERLQVYRLDAGFWAVEMAGEFDHLSVRFDGNEEIVAAVHRKRKRRWGRFPWADSGLPR